MNVFPQDPRGEGRARPAATLVQGVIQEELRQEWLAGAARWRAGALAEAIFGGPVVPRLRYARAAAGFHALVELEVPFRDLDRHRKAEARFLGAAHRDEILGGIPTVFVFTPTEPGSPAGPPAARGDAAGDPEHSSSRSRAP